MTPFTQPDFGSVLQQVAGSAFEAAGYELQANPTHQARGLFRFRKSAPEGLGMYVEFQMLLYGDAPSRFRVTLLRNKGADARDPQDPNRMEVSLSRLIWDQFGVRQLDAPDYWWTFVNLHEMAHAVAHAGRLLFGFGVPWLEGKLSPTEPSDSLNPTEPDAQY